MLVCAAYADDLATGCHTSVLVLLQDNDSDISNIYKYGLLR